MIADSTPDSGPKNKKHSITIDESAIQSSGWMTLDLTATRGVPVASLEADGAKCIGAAQERSPARDDGDAILSLGSREMAAAAMLRALQSQDHGQARGHGQSGADQAGFDTASAADETRRAWQLARQARALARARGQLPQNRSSSPPMIRQSSVIPTEAIIPVGGSDLKAYTPAQPFPCDDRAANDNRGRLLLITAMLVGISVGFAMTAKNPPTREGHEVPAPLTRDIRVSHALGFSHALGSPHIPGSPQTLQLRAELPEGV